MSSTVYTTYQVTLNNFQNNIQVPVSMGNTPVALYTLYKAQQVQLAWGNPRVPVFLQDYLYSEPQYQSAWIQHQWPCVLYKLGSHINLGQPTFI